MTLQSFLSSALYDVRGYILIPTAADRSAEDLGLYLDWEDSQKALHEIEKFADDWDGMGAKAPDPQKITTALWFLRKLKFDGEYSPPTSITASPTGSIVISWDDKKNFLEAEIMNRGQISFIQQLSNGDVLTWMRDLTQPVDERYVQISKVPLEWSLPFSDLSPSVIPQVLVESTSEARRRAYR